MIYLMEFRTAFTTEKIKMIVFGSQYFGPFQAKKKTQTVMFYYCKASITPTFSPCPETSGLSVVPDLGRTSSFRESSEAFEN